MWSIDAVETQMRDQIRTAALAYDDLQVAAKGHRIRDLLRRLRSPFSLLGKDPITSILVGALLAAAAAAAWLLLANLPMGGVAEQSTLAISQGASLIFVVILATLLVGPLEAGRTLGSDAAWIARDPMTWLGLGAISSLSLLMLVIGWARPDPREELATICMTAAGLAMTALLVRRLLQLSDPVVQLNRRRKQSIHRLGVAVSDSQSRVKAALEKAGVEDAVARRVHSFADPHVQGAFATEVKGYMAIARSASGRAEWNLAVGAYANGVATAHEYLRLVDAIADTDEVLHAVMSEADDLHQLASGASGRPFAEALMQGLDVIGRDLITLFAERERGPAERSVPGLAMIARSIQTMAARELPDLNALGPASAMRILGTLAAGAMQRGAIATTAATTEDLIAWAAHRTNVSQIHVAIPAWEEALGLMTLIFRTAEPHDLAQVHRIHQRLALSLERIDVAVIGAPVSGLDPILRSSSNPGKLTLQLAWYDLWDSPVETLAEVADFGRLIRWQLANLLRRLPPGFSPKHYVSSDLADILYQDVCAAATRLDRETDAATRGLIVESMLNALGWIRGWAIPESGPPDQEFDLAAMMHCYFSGLQVVLHAERETSEPREVIVGEVNAFLDRLTPDTGQALPGCVEEGLQLLESWLSRVGHADLVASVREARERYEGPPTDIFSSDSGWGPFSSGYHTRRGGLIPGIVARVEEYFESVRE